MTIDPKTTPAVTFNTAINDYMDWVVTQPYIRKRFYTFTEGVPALMKLIVKHLGGKVLDVDSHTCLLKYKGINFVVEAKNHRVYSICEDY